MLYFKIEIIIIKTSARHEFSRFRFIAQSFGHGSDRVDSLMLGKNPARFTSKPSKRIIKNKK